MNRIGLTASNIKSREMEWDNFFAHRIYGAIGLTKALIAKQAIALKVLNVQQSKFAEDFDQSELAYMEECIKDYNKYLKGKLKETLKPRKYERLSNDELEYGINYKLSEITELYDERAQKKVDLNLAFVQVLKETRAKRVAIRLAVTGG